jgi:CheY-like chemotaxis protein
MSDVFSSATPGNNNNNDPQNLPAGMSPGGEGISEPAAQCEKRRQEDERRSRRRVMISAPIRVRSLNTTCGGPDEVSTTLDVSRAGMLFVSSQREFAAGMEIGVTFPYSKTPGTVQAEQTGRIVRVTEISAGRYSVAIALGCGAGEDIIDVAGRKLDSPAGPATPTSANVVKKPLILVVDADPNVRNSLKTYLATDGYEVLAVASAREGQEILKLFTPVLLIAEIEGDDLPGFELCAHVKSTPRLQTVPVMLLTSSAYPTDYANAHALGAIVCMAKPYRQERLGHVVRLLAPTRQAKEQTAPPRPADQTRRPTASKEQIATSAATYAARYRLRRKP